ncbi:hypothetical protein ACFLUZ_03340 [Chloroflexota bacterium]
MDDIRTTICSAIHSKQIIRFYYHGGLRVVEPLCFGVIMPGNTEVLWCYQVSGYGEFGDPFGWKLFRASEMIDLVVTDEHFIDIRPEYNLSEALMTTIYCQVVANIEPEVEIRKPIEYKPSDAAMLAIYANISAKMDNQMKTGKPKKPFTTSYIRMIRLARKLNHNKKISGDVYFHPTEKRVLVKTIDLIRPNTLVEVNIRRRTRLSDKDRQYWEERWLEAYLIKQAKTNNWKLKLLEKEYIFLLSQLRFRRDPGKGERQRKTLDLLLYDDEKQHLVALELKSQVDISVLNTVKSELGDYVTRLEELVTTGFISKAFGLAEIKGISACLVCQRTDISYDLGNYGLIEFVMIENPWEIYRESGQAMEIMFTSKKALKPSLKKLLRNVIAVLEK